MHWGQFFLWEWGRLPLLSCSGYLSKGAEAVKNIYLSHRVKLENFLNLDLSQCPKVNVYFQGAFPKEPSSLVGFPRLNQKLCRTKLSWLLHGKRMGPPTFCTFDCPFMALQKHFIDNPLICESCYVHFPKWWLPVTLINSHWPINTPKKVWLPNLFVGCDSKSNKIHIFILLDSLQEAPVNLFYPIMQKWWL